MDGVGTVDRVGRGSCRAKATVTKRNTDPRKRATACLGHPIAAAGPAKATLNPPLKMLRFFVGETTEAVQDITREVVRVQPRKSSCSRLWREGSNSLLIFHVRVGVNSRLHRSRLSSRGSGRRGDGGYRSATCIGSVPTIAAVGEIRAGGWGNVVLAPPICCGLLFDALLCRLRARGCHALRSSRGRRIVPRPHNFRACLYHFR